MKRIPLTRGEYTIVDDADYPLVNKYRWVLLVGHGGKKYAVRYENHKAILLHRFLLRAPKGKDVDHKNGNSLDNRRSNIRCCEHWQNMANRGLQANNTTGYKGVYLHSGKWRAMYCHNQRLVHIGMFTTAVEAAKAYNQKALEIYGEFAQLNRI